MGQKGLTGRLQEAQAPFMPKAMSARSEVNLIGMTTDEAIPEMEKFLDDISGASGDGQGGPWPRNRSPQGCGAPQAREALLCKKSFRLGEYGEGDTGVTIVTFK